jgi:hypothetical protein
MRRTLIAAGFVLAFAPAFAQQPAPAGPEREAPPSALFTPEVRDALESLGRAMLRLYRAVPRYEAPRMRDNGDIVIPRAPDAQPLYPPEQPADGTRQPIAA